MPNRFNRIISTGSTAAAFNTINQNFAQLDAEAVKKQFKDANGNSMISGNLGEELFGTSLLDSEGTGMFMGLYRANRFGTVYYFKGTPVGLDGMAPDDGRIGSWRAKPGQNVITLLGG
ncbi:hypothetical protein [Arthrobacter cavernae]|uniref:Uncharacterized protein n=1 Tax=Arthrobacter cavernae TaxID=2817681 RepID=A0A939KLF3_9MICC|nr:hypothetical protein [Arthrobacter cavernae]MBO1267091.1 hypothetical protein [Arthrobacter cavernae]